MGEPSIKNSVARSSIDATLEQFMGEQRQDSEEEVGVQKRRIRIAAL